MDISASAFNLHLEENAKAILEEESRISKAALRRTSFTEMIVSCKSLSQYEGTSIKSALPQVFASVIAASFHIVVGISLAYSAILIPQLEDPGSDVEVTKAQSSWIASVIVVIVPIGSIVGGFIMERFGRLNTIKLATVPGIAGWIMLALANDVPFLLMGRLLTGLASALGSSPAIVYITEVARPDMRGSLISACPTLASLGMVIAYCKGWFMHWRTVAWFGNFYTIFPCVLVFFIPDSPVWLVSRGRIEDARDALNWFNRMQPQPDHKVESLAEMQLSAMMKEREIKLSEQRRSGGQSRRFAAFLRPTGYKPMLMLFFLFIFQQFSGIYITLFYAVTFFEEAGTGFNAYMASVFVGVVRFIMSMVNTWLLKKFKRRPLVMLSGTGMCICMTVSGFFTLWIKEGTTSYNWVPVACLLLYVCTSMLGLLTIPWTMTAELFPTEIRGLAHSIAYSIGNLTMFVAVQCYRDLSYYLGGSHAVQWFFAAVSISAVLYAFVFLPETHGKKLSDIQKYFETNTIYLGQKKSNSAVKKINFKGDAVDKATTEKLMSKQTSEEA